MYIKNTGPTKYLEIRLVWNSSCWVCDSKRSEGTVVCPNVAYH